MKKRITIFFITILMMASTILPSFAFASETDTHHQYTAFSDRRTVLINLEKYVGKTKALQIVFSLDDKDYWNKGPEERTRIINSYEKNDSSYTLIDLLVKEDITPSKYATYVQPDLDFWFNQVLGLKLPQNTSVYEGLYNQMKDLLGFRPTDFNDKTYRDNPVFFGDDMQEYFKKNGSDQPKTTIFETDTLDWLYSPEGFLSDYFENRNQPLFTQEEVKVLMQPPGYGSDQFFKQLDFLVNTTAFGGITTGQVEITAGAVLVKMALGLKPIFWSLKKFIPKSIAKWLKILEPSLPELASVIPNQKFIIKNGNNVTERSLPTNGLIAEFPSVLGAAESGEAVQSIQAGVREYKISENSAITNLGRPVELWGPMPKNVNTAGETPDLLSPIPPNLKDILGVYNRTEAKEIIDNLGVEDLIRLQNNLMRIEFGYDETTLIQYFVPKDYTSITNKFTKSLFEQGRILKIVRSDDPLLYNPILGKQVAIRTIRENDQSVIIFSSSMQGKDDLVTLEREIFKIYDKELADFRITPKFDDPGMAESAINYNAREFVNKEFSKDTNPITRHLINAHYHSSIYPFKTQADYTADLWTKLSESVFQGLRRNKTCAEYSDQELRNIVDTIIKEITYVTGDKGLQERLFFQKPEMVKLFSQLIRNWDIATQSGNMTSAVKRELEFQDNNFFKLVEDLVSNPNMYVRYPEAYQIFGKKYEQIWKKPHQWFRSRAIFQHKVLGL